MVGIDWSFLAADGAMTKAPLGGPKTGPNPTDRAKKGSSARSSRRARVSRSGSITAARTATNHKLLKGMLDSIPIKASQAQAHKRSRRASAWTRPTTTAEVRELGSDYRADSRISARAARRSSDKAIRAPGWRARRWVVEACHSWLNRNRAILIRWSKKDENYLALLQLAAA